MAANNYLLILGHRAGLAWVLGNSRMAFTEARAREGERLRVGDLLFLYTSRGCFGNPTRDRSRIIGEAEVMTLVRKRQQPAVIASHEFTHDCQIDLKSLAAFRDGVEIADLVDQFEVFPDPRAWSSRLRRPLLKLPPGDAKLIRTLLKPYVLDPDETRSDYLAASRLAPSRQ